MANIKIDRFPQAFFIPTGPSAYLCFYYPYSAIKEGKITYEQWENQSYSSEILRYKEGLPASLKYFLPAVHSAIKQIMSNYGETTSYIVPVPSSIAHDHSDFKSTPRLKGEKSRNRDNRNTVFCNLLAAHDTSIVVKDCLKRIHSKPAKESWNETQHSKSISISYDKVYDSFAGLFFLFDDVVTDGGTIRGAKSILEQKFPNAKIVKFSIGLSQHPGAFQPLFPS